MALKPILNEKRGFTLAETTVVLVILGVLVAISFPAFSKYSASHQLQGATNALIADMHWARSTAVSKRLTFHIEFATDGYQIIENGSGEVVRTRTLPDALSFAASGDPNFYAWGMADPTDVTITRGSRTMNLTLLANGNASHY
jgi:prepilin-type N-terminal cleavage/methylation domain-containing protein